MGINAHINRADAGKSDHSRGEGEHEESDRGKEMGSELENKQGCGRVDLPCLVA